MSETGSFNGEDGYRGYDEPVPNRVRVRVPAESGVPLPEYEAMQESLLDVIALVNYLAQDYDRLRRVPRRGRGLRHVAITRSHYGSPDQIQALIETAYGLATLPEVQSAVTFVHDTMVTLATTWGAYQGGRWAQFQLRKARREAQGERIDGQPLVSENSERPSQILAQQHTEPPTIELPSQEELDVFEAALNELRASVGNDRSTVEDRWLTFLGAVQRAYAEGRMPNELRMLISVMWLADSGGDVDQQELNSDEQQPS